MGISGGIGRKQRSVRLVLGWVTGDELVVEVEAFVNNNNNFVREDVTILNLKNR